MVKKQRFILRTSSFLVVYFLLLVSMNLRCEAQEVADAGHFWALNGTVQLLPTGSVLKREEGKTTFFSYHNGKYVPDPAAHVQQPLDKWLYFDWASVDWNDQIDRNNSEIPDGSFWPQNSKVKKVMYLTPRKSAEVSVLVCYTLPEQKEEHPLLPTASQIWIVALRGKRTDSGYSYKKLWSRQLQKESNFGELTVQELPGVGKALVLYSASAGGSAESEQLDIYVFNR